MRLVKIAFVLMALGFTFHTAFGQAYIVTYIKGDVYSHDKPLKLHDRLDGANGLTSSEKTAEIALFSAQKGKFRLSFVNSKPIAAGPATKKSELYQLVVGNYLMAYTTEKTLTARGDFDLKRFFNGNAKDGSDSVLLLEGELLPIKSPGLKNNPADKYYLCILKGKDTVRNLVARNSSFLIFDRSVFPGLTQAGDAAPQPEVCFIKRGYTLNGQYKEETFSEPANATFLTKEYLQNLISTFQEGLATYYANDKQKMIADIESQLTFYYGNSFEQAVHQVLTNLLNGI